MLSHYYIRRNEGLALEKVLSVTDVFPLIYPSAPRKIMLCVCHRSNSSK